jgi:23S rRNA maturation-related 3'-5' exoribonuclease YhaM
MAQEQFFTPMSGKSNIDTLILKDDVIEISDDVIEISDDVIEILDLSNINKKSLDKSNYKEEKQVKRGRGRPPKAQNKITKSKANKMVTTESYQVKRGRGRPPKAQNKITKIIKKSKAN